MNSKEVLIVGAGAAGLMAGCELVDKGFRVTIVEARDRIGGRICTIHNLFSTPADIGAEFVHGDKDVTSSLVKEAKLKLVKMKGEMYRVENGSVKESDFFDDDWSKVVKKLKSLDHDLDMGTFMDVHFNRSQYPKLYENVKRFIEGYDAADLHTVSALALRDEWSGTDDDNQFHIEGGYGRLMEYLAEKFQQRGGTIRLSAPVKEVRWREAGVELITAALEHFVVPRVVMTVPLGVLVHERILFKPGLGEYQRAFSDIGFGGVIKFIIEFDDAYWNALQENAGLKDLAFVFSDGAIPTWWSQMPDKRPVITGWLGGPETRHISHNKQELYKVAVATLGSIFKIPAKEIMTNVRQWHIANWLNDEYSLGAYSFPTVKTQAARKLLSEPLKGVLYFAGEAFFDGPDMGTVEAALESGRQVARRISEVNSW